MSKNLKVLLPLFGDIVALYLSLYLVLWFRYGTQLGSGVWDQHFLPFTIVYLIWLGVFYVLNLYSLAAIWNVAEFFRKFTTAMLVNTAVAIFFFYLIPYFGITPKTNLFLDLVVFTLLFSGWRFIYSKIIRAVGTTNNLVLIGAHAASIELARKILDHPELGYSIVAVFNLNGESLPKWLKDSGILVGENLSQLEKLVRSGEINSVVVSNEIYADIFGDLYRLIPTGADFQNLSSFWEEFDRSIPVSETDEVWFLENLRGVRKRLYEIRKRGIDIFFSIVFGLVFLALFPLIVLGIKLSGPGPVFYFQKRVGKDGKTFEMVKFRTMVPDAEKNGAQWAEKDDPRITKFGRFLRNMRLDELPQLINVLKGEMSFIGPRPERPEFVDRLSEEIPHYDLRHLIRPGVTGWAQINYPYGSSEDDAAKKLRYDLYYLKNRSFLLDGEIVLRTIGVVLSRKGR
ncbi:MAG: hypothetical protein BMS9Abin34_390 [Patescibacteria group bacterium]|nr:MAG: hypothetical protein BMS9Abin34_390 [Patescibacteria group bacterium]